jgi:fructose-1,6-bisphosphatase-3
MNDRLLLSKIDYLKGEIILNGKNYRLNDSNFPTIDENNPEKLTKEENVLMDRLTESFLNNEKLQKHIRYLFSKGAIYSVYNNNLLFHGEIPLTKEGELKNVSLFGKYLKGKELLDYFDKMARIGYFEQDNESKKNQGLDLMWYLWCGKNSPLFGKNKMTTFERYFIDDEQTHKENKNPYFLLRENEEIINKILIEFGLKPDNSKIINGHVPVKVKKGEHPLKANKKLIVIDGGFSKAYQKVTGIAGYTLIYNSWGLLLASHEPFSSVDDAIKNETDIKSSMILLDKVKTRTQIKDTDEGVEIKAKIHDLKRLVKFYQNGIIRPQK